MSFLMDLSVPPDKNPPSLWVRGEGSSPSVCPCLFSVVCCPCWYPESWGFLIYYHRNPTSVWQGRKKGREVVVWLCQVGAWGRGGIRESTAPSQWLIPLSAIFSSILWLGCLNYNRLHLVIPPVAPSSALHLPESSKSLSSSALSSPAFCHSKLAPPFLLLSLFTPPSSFFSFLFPPSPGGFQERKRINSCGQSAFIPLLYRQKFCCTWDKECEVSCSISDIGLKVP